MPQFLLSIPISIAICAMTSTVRRISGMLRRAMMLLRRLVELDGASFGAVGVGAAALVLGPAGGEVGALRGHCVSCEILSLSMMLGLISDSHERDDA